MIVKCSHCAGSMRVDESRIPKGQSVKIRCPHCKEIQVFRDSSIVDRTPAPRAPAQASSFHEESAPRQRGASNGISEHPLPSDAFETFRFPSEKETSLHEQASAGQGFGIVTWLLISLGVISVFALLVNLILSGPR